MKLNYKIRLIRLKVIFCRRISKRLMTIITTNYLKMIKKMPILTLLNSRKVFKQKKVAKNLIIMTSNPSRSDSRNCSITILNKSIWWQLEASIGQKL
jgi:hypothetical protein